MFGAHTVLIGRESELSRLRGLVDPAPEQGRALVLLGDPGTGKTALLSETARGARSAGLAVLAVTGRESEQDLAFAGLHQPLRPVLDRARGGCWPRSRIRRAAGRDSRCSPRRPATRWR